MLVEVVQQHPVGASGVARRLPPQEAAPPSPASRGRRRRSPRSISRVSGTSSSPSSRRRSQQPREHEDRDDGDAQQDAQHAERDRDRRALLGRQRGAGRRGAGRRRVFEAASTWSTAALAVWLTRAGYNTLMLSKYLNGYDAPATRTYVPPGWATGKSRCWPTYNYRSFTMNENGTLVHYSDPVDHVRDRGIGSINGIKVLAALRRLAPALPPPRTWRPAATMTSRDLTQPEVRPDRAQRTLWSSR